VITNAKYDYIVVGSGIGGLTAAAMLSYHGNAVLVLESHYETGGAAHGFTRHVKTKKNDDDDDDDDELEFVFDTGPSFFAGLTTPNALNPLASVLNVLGESLEAVKYDPLGTFHIEKDVPGLRRRGFGCVVRRDRRLAKEARKRFARRCRRSGICLKR